MCATGVCVSLVVVDKKLGDVEKVAALLTKSGGVLVPPTGICIDLLQLLSFKGITTVEVLC